MRTYTFAPRVGPHVTVRASSEAEARRLCMAERYGGVVLPHFMNRGLGLLLLEASGD